MLGLEEYAWDTHALDWLSLRDVFQRQNEFLVLEEFLPPALLASLQASLPALMGAVNRNYLPGHKKGGSISRFTLDALAPVFAQVYTAPELLESLRLMTGAKLLPCPPEDPHTYALYLYTEAGDHIGWHYDTSYYRGARYTVLIGLVDESSCRLEYQLIRGAAGRETETHALALCPGMMVIFNGDKLYHRITPLGENERRIVLTMEFVTNPGMTRWGRFVSNIKDAIAYFGFKDVFRRRMNKLGHKAVWLCKH